MTMDIPATLKVVPNKQHPDQTLEELRTELAYWEERVRTAPGPASAGMASGQGKSCQMWIRIKEGMTSVTGNREVEERAAVRELGERIGYGRVMQLAERIWDRKTPGEAHSVGPCTSMLFECPHEGNGAVGCGWCCGSGRITARVRVAMDQAHLFGDVGRFHRKFDLDVYPETKPHFLSESNNAFRTDFMQEELDEYQEACAQGDLAKAADALGDLVWVALGTAHLMGIPFDDVWKEIARANMQKERATGANDPRSKRKHALDVVKPAGWTAPDHTKALENAGWRSNEPGYPTGDPRSPSTSSTS